MLKFRKRDLLTGGVARYDNAERTATMGARIPYLPATVSEGRLERAAWKSGVTPAGSQAQYGQQQNDQAEQLVLAVARPMLQPTMAQSLPGNNVAQNQTINFNLNNVGLQRKLYVVVTGTIAQAAAETLKLTPWGPANIFSNITLTDLSNYQRINTTGLHMFALACLRHKRPFGSAFVNDSPIKMGSNLTVNDVPNAVTVAKPFRFIFEIPLAYHDRDLRGAIYSNVTNAQWRLSLTVNPNFVVGSGATDTLFNVYQSTTAGDVGVLSAFNVQVYQDYLDQLPRGKNGQPVVPLISLAWNYLILSTVSTGMVAANDFPVQYANFRTFLSTIAIFDNAGTFNPGTDVNYLGIQVANQTFLEKYDAFLQALKVRAMVQADFPAGTYVIDHRKWPIVTDQFGNTQFVLNASTVNAGASLQMMYEMLSVQNQAINAGSLAAG